MRLFALNKKEDSVF